MILILAHYYTARISRVHGHDDTCLTRLVVGSFGDTNVSLRPYETALGVGALIRVSLQRYSALIIRLIVRSEQDLRHCRTPVHRLYGRDSARSCSSC